MGYFLAGAGVLLVGVCLGAIIAIVALAATKETNK